MSGREEKRRISLKAHSVEVHMERQKDRLSVNVKVEREKEQKSTGRKINRVEK